MQLVTASGTIWASEALLPDGWASAVSCRLDEHGSIAEVRTGQAAAQATWRVDVLLPGMANVHSHAHQRAMAGLAEHAHPDPAARDSFWTWRESMYRYLGQLGPDAMEAIGAQLYVEMLKAGYTAVGEFQYLHHDPDGQPYAQRAELTFRCHAAARQAGIAICTLPVLYRYGGFGDAPAQPSQGRFLNTLDEYLLLLEQVAEALGADPDATYGVAPHSLRAVSPALLQELLDACEAHPSAPVHIHIAEQQREVDECLAWCGQRPVERLLAHHGVDARWCLIHATHMSAQETRALAESGACVGLCPSTEANLGDGLFDARSYLTHGGRWAIGSDSNVSVSPVEELRWLEYGQRLRYQARNVMGDSERGTGAALFAHAAREGNAALARAAGTISVGQRADLIALDGSHPRLVGARGDGWLDRWVFSGNDPLVQHVWVGGRPVVTDGHHPREAAIAERFRRVMASLINS